MGELVVQLGIENLLNVILVDAGIRPAMLIQPADVGEASSNDPKTKSILNAIKLSFPSLIYSEKYQIYQGIIISKTKKYDGEHISLEHMGKILGYPCYKEFNEIRNDEVSYSVSIYVYLSDKTKIQLIGNICKKQNIYHFKKLANEAQDVFFHKKYNKYLNDIAIQKVDVEIEKNIPTQQLIDKLIDNHDLDIDEKNKIMNMFFNFGFSEETQIYLKDNIQYNNPIHKGIIIDLLVRELHDTLSAFYPLQNYPDHYTYIKKITQTWEQTLIHIIEKSKNKKKTTSLWWGGKKTRKSKK